MASSAAVFFSAGKSAAMVLIGVLMLTRRPWGLALKRVAVQR